MKVQVPFGPDTFFVLGANSFSGQDFVDLLLNEPGVRVIGVGRSPERGPLYLKYRSHPNLANYEYHALDVNHQGRELLDLLDDRRPAGIVNFTALSEVAPSWEQPADWFRTNCVALAQMVNELRRRDYLQRFVQISSPEVYGTCVGRVVETAPLNPSTPYAVSKAAADMLLEAYRRQYGFPVVWVRATNVYGARQQLFKIIPRSIIYALTDRMIELHGGGRAVKSYIHIRDVSRGELNVLKQGRIGQIYHLSPDEGLPVRDIVAKVCGLLNVDFDAATRTVDERPGQDAAYVIDSSLARDEFRWQPEISLEEGLRETIDWVRGNLDEILQLPLNYEHRT